MIWENRESEKDREKIWLASKEEAGRKRSKIFLKAIKR